MDRIARQSVVFRPGRASGALSGVFFCLAAFGCQGTVVAQDKSAEPAPLAGCEDQVKSGGPKGSQERFFPAPIEKVRAAAADAVNALEFEIKKQTKDMIEAHKARHVGVFVGSGGENIVLSFKETTEGGQNGTLVKGETKKTMVGRLAQKTWTSAVLAQTACFLQKDTAK